MENTYETKRAMVGVFDDRYQAEQAVDALYKSGFSHDQVGFVIRGSDAVRGGMIVDTVGTKDGKGAAAGMITGSMVGGVLAAAVSLMIPGVGPLMAGGILAAFFGGAIAGTAVGGILGAMAGLGVSEDEAKFYQQEFNEGRAIVAVKSEGRGAEAAHILVGHGGRHVHMEPRSPLQTEGLFSTP